MNREKVHKIVEYIRSQSEFPFDAGDVEENIQDVLAWFGIEPVLEEAELAEIRAELVPLAIREELAEVARVVEAELS